MAVYLRYERVREDEQEVEYEVRGVAETPAHRLRIRKDDPSLTVVPDGLPAALAHKVVGRAVRALEAQGSWPEGGLIQS